MRSHCEDAEFDLLCATETFVRYFCGQFFLGRVICRFPGLSGPLPSREKKLIPLTNPEEIM